VEFALILPVLMLLIIGILDFGRAFNYWIDQQHLANEAARWAAVNKSPVSGQSLETAIRNQANTAELRSIMTPVCVWHPTGSGASGQPVEVKVKANYSWLRYLVGTLGFGTSTLTGKATMRIEVSYKGDSTDAYTAQASCP
jgi:Flp pilus assembly protein TadG